MPRSRTPVPERLALVALLFVTLAAAAFVWFRDGGGVVNSERATEVGVVRDVVAATLRSRSASGSLGAPTTPSEAMIGSESGATATSASTAASTSIEGTVLDRDSGEAAVGMHVVAYPVRDGVPVELAGMGLPLASAVVDSDGDYRMAIANGSRRLYVLARTGTSDYVEPDPARAREIAFDDRETVAGVDFFVRRGRVVRGTVVDASNGPVENAVVRFFPRDLSERSADAAVIAPHFERFRRITAVTDARGRFERSGLPPDVSFHVVAMARGLAPASVEVDTSNAAHVSIALDSGSAVEGTVVFEDGAPAPGVVVRPVVSFRELVERPDANVVSDEQYTTVTAMDGSFRIANLPAGRFSLAAGDSRVVVPGRTNRADVRLDGRTDVRDLEIFVAKLDDHDGEKTIELWGFVVDDTGVPVVDATVTSTTADELASRTDEAGGFQVVVDDASDAWGLRVSKVGHRTVRLVVNDETKALPVVVLDRVGILRGRVFAADDAPIAGSLEMTVAPASDPTWRHSQAGANITPARDGAGVSFELTSGVLGPVVVLARAPGYAPARSAPIDLEPGQTVEGIEVFFVRSGTIVGLVTNARGEPVGDAAVHVRVSLDASVEVPSRTAPALARVFTDPHGRFVIDDLAPGSYELDAIHARSIASPTIPVDVAEGVVSDAGRLELADPASIHGRITREGDAVAHAFVQLHLGGDESVPRSTRTSADGSFEIGGLPEGRHVLLVSSPASASTDPSAGSFVTSTREVRVEAGMALRVDVDLEGRGVRLSGRVTSPASVRRDDLYASLRRGEEPDSNGLGAPRPSAETRQSLVRDQAGAARLGADGRFDFGGLERGTYLLEILSLEPGESETPLWSRRIEVLEDDLFLEIDLD